MKAKRLVSALTMIALLAGIFAGCSGDGGTTSSPGGDSSTAGDSSAAESTGGDTEKFNTTLNVIGAVSYTHLDVYKRQVCCCVVPHLIIQ